MDNGWGVEVSGLDEFLESFDRYGRGLLAQLPPEEERPEPETRGRLTETLQPVTRGRLSSDAG